jgi:hypothetical protein
MAYCGKKHRDGWYCVLASGHVGEHLSIDNTKMWKGSPGRPVFWRIEAKKGAEGPVEPNPTLTQAEYARSQGYTGETCSNCLGMRMRRNGTCQLCDDCGQTTGCS